MESVGYLFLIEKYQLNVLRPLVCSYLTDSSTKTEKSERGCKEVFYPKWRHSVAENWQAHLNFAIKYEGVNLEVLKALFKRLPEAEIIEEIRSKPSGGYCHRLWFLYEFLMDTLLPIPDASLGNFVKLLDDDLQWSLSEKYSVRSKRHRVINNLPGVKGFCPMIRQVKSVKKCSTDLQHKVNELVSSYPADLLYRAVQYLYIKETKSSFAIERESPDQKRTETFVALLKDADKDFFSKESLCGIQRRIVDKNYAQDDWRHDQVYVGETLSPTEERVHFVAVKPEDLDGVMTEFLAMSHLLDSADCDAICAAVVIGFAFVFLHPFDDGNGRTHRFLLHNVLSRKGFTPPRMVFPVSANLLKNQLAYDAMLESFSERLMPLLDYRINEIGEINVLNDTSDFYRYIDFTPIVEAFQKIVADTIETEWRAELDYLKRYDQIRARMRNVVDMPEKKANQFILFVQQNGGKFPSRRRDFFMELDDETINKLENAVSLTEGENVL